MKILSVVGARPNIMKLAAVHHALRDREGVEHAVIHTGQHYDRNLSGLIFEELGLPLPDENLEIGSGSHASQTALVMTRIEETLSRRKPDAVVVYGDVNSTMAAALTAVKLGVTVAHVEAGLRSYDRGMPEEINRVVTDHAADILLAPDRDAVDLLGMEGLSNRARLVGNTMFDTLLRMLPRLETSREAGKLGLADGHYAVSTLHRPINVDNLDALRDSLDALHAVSRLTPVVLPVHPRTMSRIRNFGLERLLRSDRIIPRDPLGYIDFLSLVRRSAGVITDSGGIQEETSFLGVPCLTIRPNTERPWTVSRGTNRLVTEIRSVPGTWADMMELRAKGAFKPYRDELTDGQVGGRIADLLMESD